MQPRTRRARVLDFGVLVILLATAALAMGAVFYQFQLYGLGHAHAGGAGWLAYLTMAVDSAGFLLMFLLAVQFFSGYGLLRLPRPRFRPFHVRFAWAVVAVLAFHASGAVYHSLTGFVEVLPLWLDAIGAGLAALLAVQLVSGYRQGPKRGHVRALHAVVALALSLAVVGHAVLGIVHTVQG